MSEVRITSVTIPGFVDDREARTEELARVLPIERQDIGVPEQIAAQWFRPIAMIPVYDPSGYLYYVPCEIVFPDPPSFCTVSSQRTILTCQRLPPCVFEPR